MKYCSTISRFVRHNPLNQWTPVCFVCEDLAEWLMVFGDFAENYPKLTDRGFRFIAAHKESGRDYWTIQVVACEVHREYLALMAMT